MKLPELFRWFAVDFADYPGGIAGFLERHLPDGPVRRALLDRGRTIIEFVPRDWRLPLPLT